MRISVSIALAALLSCGVWGSDDLDALLGEYAQKADLSEQTRRESAGFLQVYTRQDLDRMQIRQLKELLERIPFFRYTEDKYGLTNPFYEPYQPPVPNGVKVYINDHTISGVFTNDGLRVFGQMDMSFIDHAEIYLGIPSQTFGIESAYYVIKLYTKNPKRENTSLIGALLGSRGTSEVYGYQAGVKENFDYLAFANYSHLNRQDVKAPNGNTLHRDKEYSTGYGQLQSGHHRLELQVMKGKSDAFMGDSPDLMSINPDFDFSYFYGGWYYDNPDNGLKAFVNASYSVSLYDDRTEPPYPLGFYEIEQPPYVQFYYEDHTRIEEFIYEAQLKKRFKYGKFVNETGLQARYKKFNLADTPYPSPDDYNAQTLLSFFSEESYLFDDHRMAVASIKVDRSIENGHVEDSTVYSGRVGFIYNNGNWISKSFLMYAESLPVMQAYYANRYLFHQDEDPDKEQGAVGATKLIYRTGQNEISFLASKMFRKDSCYFFLDENGNGKYGNLPDTMSFNTFMAELKHNFSPLAKISLNGWESINILRNGLGSSKTFGGVLSWSATVDKLDMHTDFIYQRFEDLKPGLDWNMAVTYRYSRALSLFLKANDILGRALKQNYYVYNPLTGVTTRLDGVDVIDRRLWVGLEYQF
ncbi:MAG: hypothetical protein GXO33_01335 [Epsilonproteobacteria bacterium]|nr:hypothetical protein [Campylobacterota bacterium]